jgi:hypothetical protein
MILAEAFGGAVLYPTSPQGYVDKGRWCRCATQDSCHSPMTISRVVCLLRITGRGNCGVKHWAVQKGWRFGGPSCNNWMRPTALPEVCHRPLAPPPARSRPQCGGPRRPLSAKAAVDADMPWWLLMTEAVRKRIRFVVMPTEGRIFAFFCFERDHKPQNSGCRYTAQSFHTALTRSRHRQSNYFALRDSFIRSPRRRAAKSIAAL